MDKRINIPFNQRLTEYCDQSHTVWHMPGHKRLSEVSGDSVLEAAKKYDVTELPALDDLYEPKGTLRESMNNLTRIYGSTRSYYQVNGSTGGILTAVSAVTGRGESILMARNCHRSVYHAVALLELTPYYLEPPMIGELGIYGGITAKQVEQAIREHPEIRTVVLTSPTYEGVISDIAGIVQAAHQAGVHVIVDEAHGAHIIYDSQEIESAVELGADLVIESLHKTLPCYTQCAILHIGNQLMDPDPEAFIRRVERYIRIYQTTSPSYLFIADMERVIALMDQWRDTEYPAYLDRLRRYRRRWEQLRHIHLISYSDVEGYGGYQYDESKLVFVPDLISGEELRCLLDEDYGQVMEMAVLKYTLAISTVADSEASFRRLDQALWKIDEQLEHRISAMSTDAECISGVCKDYTEQEKLLRIPVLKGIDDRDGATIVPGVAWNLPWEYMVLREAEGKLAGDYVTVYPPGIPVCVPGEKITAAVIEHLVSCSRENLTIQGIKESGN